MSKKENSDECCTLPGKVIFFATGNVHKFNEVRSLLGPMGFAVALIRLKGDEVQSEDIKEIATKTVKNAYSQSKLPIFVEDAGLFIADLKGFPGPYAAYVFKTIQNRGVLKLMENVKVRQATFKSAIAYLDATLNEPRVFEGFSEGKITDSERKTGGEDGFGFDPIFQPDGSNKTFAEMTLSEKNGFSHRAKAVRNLLSWLKEKA